jgi:polysaccharide biosynthesis/export protein
MRTAVFSVLLSVALGLEAQEPKAPVSAPPAARENKGPNSATPGVAPAPARPADENLKPSFAPGTAADPAALASPNPAGAKIPNAAPIDAKAYIIGAKDVLAILVWNQPEFASLPHVVRPDGKISLPYVGEIQAAGKTPEQLRQDIAERLTETIREPNVTVSVTQVNSRKYFIQGEVLRPGEFDLIVPTTILQGLVQAGGFREFANQKNIIVYRGTGEKILKFNYRDVIKGKHREQNVLLEPGDIIVVK